MRSIDRATSTIALGALLLAGQPIAVWAASPLPTNMMGVTAMPQPPASFDPLTASDAALEQAGIPPRPGEVSGPAFESWKRAVSAGAQRVTPILKRTGIKHGPARARDVKHGLSSNWSGFVVTKPVNSFGLNSYSSVFGDYVVPVAQQAFGTCTGDWDYASTWIGIDGYDSPDVLQAGTDADAYCSNGKKATEYYAWYEWYPDYSITINNFPIAPGDDIFDEVWATSSTSGHVFMVNYTTNKSLTLNFTAPSGTKLIGNNAEWIVERPSVGDYLATLTNYTQDFFEGAYALDSFKHTSAPGGKTAGVTSMSVTMVDDYGNGISFPSLLGARGLWFYAAGSAVK